MHRMCVHPCGPEDEYRKTGGGSETGENKNGDVDWIVEDRR